MKNIIAILTLFYAFVTQVITVKAVVTGEIPVILTFTKLPLTLFTILGYNLLIMIIPAVIIVILTAGLMFALSIIYIDYVKTLFVALPVFYIIYMVIAFRYIFGIG